MYSPNYSNIIEVSNGTYYTISKDSVLQFTGKLWQGITSQIDLSDYVRNDMSLNSMEFNLTTQISQFIQPTNLIHTYTIDVYDSTGVIQTNSFTYCYDYNTYWDTEVPDRRLLNDPITYNWVQGSIRSISVMDLSNTQTDLYYNTTTVHSVTAKDFAYIVINSTNNLSFSYGSPDSTDSLQLSFGEQFNGCHSGYELVYVNKYGGVDSLLLLGNVIESYNNNPYRIDTNYVRSNPSSHQFKTISNVAKRVFTCNTGWLSEAESEKMDNLLLSPKVWLYDINNRLLMASNIITNQFTIQDYNTTTSLINYEINVEIAQDILRLHQ